MRPIVTTSALTLASALIASAGLAAEEEPWKKPGWEPITEQERQPATPGEMAASAVDVQDFQGIRYLTGGLGSGERAWLEQHGGSYPVALQFSTGERGAFVSSVDVTIWAADGETRFEATTGGPMIFIDLPPGRYSATANYQGHDRDFTLQVPTRGQTRHAVNFP